jgi:hypothetical protein
VTWAQAIEKPGQRLGAAAVSAAATLVLAMGFDLIEPPAIETGERGAQTVLRFIPRMVLPEAVGDAPAPRRPAVRAPARGAPEPQPESSAITLPPPSAGMASDPAAGLRGLLGRDPCLDKQERLKHPECPPEIALGPEVGKREAAIGATLDRQQFLTFAQRKNCSVKHGCLDDLTIERTLGLKPPPRGSAAGSGLDSLSGPSGALGRLPPPNWYHVDRGFGD